MQLIGIRVQVPGSSSLREEEEEVLYLLLLNQSRFMESEINSNLHLVLEWLCESKSCIPINTTVQSAASGILRVTSFLQTMLQLKHIPSLCWITGTVVGMVCSHKEGGTWRPVLVGVDVLIVDIKNKGAMD